MNSTDQNSKIYNALLLAKKANAKQKALKNVYVGIDKERNIPVIQNVAIFIGESFEDLKTRTNNISTLLYRVSKLKKNDPKSVEKAFITQGVIFLRHYYISYSRSNLKKIHVSFAKKDYKQLTQLFDTTKNPRIQIPLYYSEGKLYATNAHTISSTEIKITEEDLYFWILPFYIDCITTFAKNGFDGWFYIDENNHVVVATNDEFCIFSPIKKFDWKYGDWLESNNRTLIAKATRDEILQNVSEGDKPTICIYKYPILKEDFLNIAKKLNDKENVVELVKTKRVELIVFNRTIGTQIKGPYPKKE